MSQKPVKRFRKISGVPRRPDGTPYGEVVASTSDLASLYPGKFELIPDEIGSTESSENKTTIIPLDKQFNGEDVSRLFEGRAEAVGTRVLKRGRSLFVVKEGDSQPLNKKGFTFESDVMSYLDSLKAPAVEKSVPQPLTPVVDNTTNDKPTKPKTTK